jgi:LPS export ABC transporter protein LptC
VRAENLLLSRKSSVFLAFGGLLLCVICGLVIVNLRTKVTPRFDTTSEELLKLPVSSTLSLRDFHRSESKEGKVIWEVRAATGEFNTERSTARLQQPVILFFDKEGKPMTLTAPLGNVVFKNETLKEARATGGASIVHDSGLTIASPELLFDGESELISTDKSAEITGEGFIANSQDLTLDTEKQILTLKEKVTTVFTRNPSTKSGTDKSKKPKNNSNYSPH